MKILYKCIRNRWFSHKTNNEMEAYYLEIEKNELDKKLMLLLKEENEQIEYQLRKFEKLYIIIDKNIKYAKCIPAGYGPNWTASGHWNMHDEFRFMYGIKINTLETLKDMEKIIFEHSCEYLNNENGLFGNLYEFNFGKYGPEMFKSFISISIVYNYFVKNNVYPIIPDEESNYTFMENGNKIIVKTTGKKSGNEYHWYGDNSCWRIRDEINKDAWDYLYFVPIIWSKSIYNLNGLYKIPHDDFYKNTLLIDKIKGCLQWFIPVEFDNYQEWLNKFKINN